MIDFTDKEADTLVKSNSVTEDKTVSYMRNNTSCQVSAKLSLCEKSALYALIKSKGCDGLTGFLKMLSKAKEVKITL